MTKKRLDRDSKWFFQGFTYYHMRIDTDDFHGLVIDKIEFLYTT